MCKKGIKHYFESIGLALLLFSFGWQCLEERANQLKYEGYIYELDEKVSTIWSGIYYEVLHSDYYNGPAAVALDVDGLNSTMRDWNQIQDEFEYLNNQTSNLFRLRSFLYILGSLFVIWAKLPKTKESIVDEKKEKK